MNQISIIGAGIGGLVTALCLEKLDIPCKVYEKARSLDAIGAGIWLSPNALQVLEWINPRLLKDVQSAGNSLDRILLANHKLEPISSSQQEFVKEKFGFTTLAIHRAKLQSILYNYSNEKNIILGKAFKTFTLLKNNDYQIEFNDGTIIRSNSIIAADGIHSSIRKALFPKSEIRYSGQTCWRGISNYELPNKLSSTGFTLWGKKLQFGVSKIENGKVYWFAVKKSKPNLKDDRTRLKNDLSDMFEGFTPMVNELIQHTPLERIIRGNLSDLAPLTQWHENRICLIGDAAHSMTPDLGQGGAQAIEDAYYLSNFIKNNTDLTTAFKRFCDYRQPKVNSLVKESRAISKVAITNKLMECVRNTVLRHSPKKIVEKRMVELYSIEKDTSKIV